MEKKYQSSHKELYEPTCFKFDDNNVIELSPERQENWKLIISKEPCKVCIN